MCVRATPNLPPDPAVAAVGNQSIPLVAHVIYRLDVGGLENGLVNLINRIPAERFRHAIICLTDYSEFRERLQRSDIPVFALRKPGGNRKYQIWRRLLKPFVDHYIAVSRDLERYLQQKIAVAPTRVTQIYNGVD